MLKKLTLLLIFFVIFFSTITQAETKKGTSLLESAFCEEGLENLTQTIVKNIIPGQDFKICTVIQNKNNYDLIANLGFAVAVKNINGDRACSAPTDTVYEFAKEGIIQEIKIPANDYVVYNPILNVPVGISGVQDICFMFQEKKELKESKDGITINIDVWRKNFMTFIIGDFSNLKNSINVSDHKLYINDKKELILELIIEGIGNVNNEIIVTSNAKNGFGWKSNGINTGEEVANGGRTKIETNFGITPDNGGLFQVDFEIEYKPKFTFEINPKDFEEGFLERKSIKGKTSLFKMPRMYSGIILAIIILLFLAFRKPKQKVIYVEKK